MKFKTKGIKFSKFVLKAHYQYPTVKVLAFVLGITEPGLLHRLHKPRHAGLQSAKLRDGQ